MNNDPERRARLLRSAELWAAEMPTSCLIGRMEHYFELENCGSHDFTDDEGGLCTKDEISRRAAEHDGEALAACRKFGWRVGVRVG